MTSSISSSSRKYPCPSELNVTDFVRIKLLSRTNYFIWRRQMLKFILSQGLVGFIHGETPQPNKNSPDYQDWERSDSLLRSWFRDTIGECEYFRQLDVALQGTAESIWTELGNNFGQLSGYWQEDRIEACKDLNRYLPLHKAALNGDWEEARNFNEKDAFRAIITEHWETALIVACRSVKRKHFVKEVVVRMSPDDLGLADRFGLTALHVAAGADNIEAAKLLVNKNPDLPYLSDADRSLPLHRAALFGRKKMVHYLLTVTKEDDLQKPFEGDSGVKLLRFLIDSRLYDIALNLLKRYPELASGSDRIASPLEVIAVKRSAFPSGTSFNLWQQMVYSGISLKLENFVNHNEGDVENPQDMFNSNFLTFQFTVKQKITAGILRIAEILVPQLKHIRGEKVIHHQALEFLKHLCNEVAKLDYIQACEIFEEPLTLAADIGIHEVVKVILDSFPNAVYLKDWRDRTVFHVAIMNRCENVFKLIYQFEELRHVIISAKDYHENTGLHFAGCLASRQRRTSVPGAALQMQRELHWFKEVERLSLPQDKDQANRNSKTPQELFDETHEDLVREGERWMRETANSCTIVGALVATVVFAAAITVPGGNNQDSGVPILSKEKSFIIFIVSDACALFTSTFSLLMFLSILTSRFAQADFLDSLPKRLIYGLVSLFLSIIFMMTAFAVTLYPMLGLKQKWITILVAALANLPVIIFAWLQFPLLLDMIKSTYGCGSSIYWKKSDGMPS